MCSEQERRPGLATGTTDDPDRAPAADTDRDLASRAIAGDQAAFDHLYRRWWAYCYRHFRQRFPSPDAFNEAYHASFVNLFLLIVKGRFPAEELAGLGFFVRYLNACLANAAHKCFHDQQRRGQPAEVEPDQLADDRPDATARADERAGELKRVVDALWILNPIDRDLVLGYYFHNASREDLAKKFGLKRDAVEKRFTRALKALREHLAGGRPEGGHR